jgi:hypothetical protein
MLRPDREHFQTDVASERAKYREFQSLAQKPEPHHSLTIQTP